MGPNYKEILNFWWFLESLSDSQWETVGERYKFNIRRSQYQRLITNNSSEVQKAASNMQIWQSARLVCEMEGRHYNQVYAAEWATEELISMHLTLEQGHSLIFIPLFTDL
jgi:hypothetical protein